MSDYSISVIEDNYTLTLVNDNQPIVIEASPSFPSTPEMRYNFTFNTLNGTNLLSVNVGNIITSIRVIITTPFNDSTSIISLGTTANNQLLFNSSNIYPNISGSYEVYPLFSSSSITPINLYIDKKTSTTGSGIIIIKY